jgi:hypothetical protein
VVQGLNRSVSVWSVVRGVSVVTVASGRDRPKVVAVRNSNRSPSGAVAVAGREQPVQEGQPVAGGQQPAVGPGRVQPPPHGQAGQADGQVDDVVQGVDLEAEQGLVGLSGEVLEAGDEESQDPDQGVDAPMARASSWLGCRLTEVESGRRAMQRTLPQWFGRPRAGSFRVGPVWCRAER